MKKVSELLFSNWTLAAVLLFGGLLYAWFKIQMFDAPIWILYSHNICIMVGVSIAAVLSGSSQSPAQQLLRLTFIFFFFWLAATEFIPFIGGRLSVLAFRGGRYLQVGIQQHWSAFYFSHLLAFSVLAGLFGGFLANLKQKHAIAMWVWVIPAIVLMVKMSTLEGYSILESRVAFVARHFLADCHAPNLDSEDFSADPEALQSCVDQLFYTAPFYGALGFSLGAWLARKQEWFKRNFFTARPPEGAAEP